MADPTTNPAVRVLATSVVVSQQLLGDAAAMNQMPLITDRLSRMACPWLYADGNPMPRLDVLGVEQVADVVRQCAARVLDRVSVHLGAAADAFEEAAVALERRR